MTGVRDCQDKGGVRSLDLHGLVRVSQERRLYLHSVARGILICNEISLDIQGGGPLSHIGLKRGVVLSDCVGGRVPAGWDLINRRVSYRQHWARNDVVLVSQLGACLDTQRCDGARINGYRKRQGLRHIGDCWEVPIRKRYTNVDSVGRTVVVIGACQRQQINNVVGVAQPVGDCTCCTRESPSVGAAVPGPLSRFYRVRQASNSLLNSRGCQLARGHIYCTSRIEGGDNAGILHGKLEGLRGVLTG